MTAERYGNGILIMPTDGSIGWLFSPGDVGYAWAQRLLSGERK